MKLMHLSDLHLGKRLNEFSLHEDQAYILHQIIQIARDERPDGILIAGDLYDKPVPPACWTGSCPTWRQRGRRCLSSAATMIRRSGCPSAPG